MVEPGKVLGIGQQERINALNIGGLIVLISPRCIELCEIVVYGEAVADVEDASAAPNLAKDRIELVDDLDACGRGTGALIGSRPKIPSCAARCFEVDGQEGKQDAQTPLGIECNLLVEPLQSRSCAEVKTGSVA